MNDTVEAVRHKKSSGCWTAAGILFLAAFALQAANLFRAAGGAEHLAVVWILFQDQIFGLSAKLIAAIALLRGRKDLFPVVAFSFSALLALLALIQLRSATGFSVLMDVLNLLVKGGVLGLILVSCTDGLAKYRKGILDCWFLPAALNGIILLIQVFGSFFRWGYRYSPLSILFTMAETGGVFFTALWAISGSPKTAAAASEKSSASAAAADDGIYCGLGKHSLLLLFTFGIWLLVWIYRVTGYTNRVKDAEERNPTAKLLLCLFVPFYQIYWTYKTAQRIDALAAEKGLASDLSTLCLLLAIFVPIIPPILMQDKLNSIVTDGGAGTAPVQKTLAERSPASGAAAELKTYKELLDAGVITQEDFEAKKKQLLGI